MGTTILASKYRPASKLENFDFEIEINGVRDRFSALPSPRARVLPEERERERKREGKCAVARVIRVLYIHTIRTSSIPWYNGSLDYRPWIDLEAVETILDGISKSREIMDSVIRVIVILVFMILLLSIIIKKNLKKK